METNETNKTLTTDAASSAASSEKTTQVETVDTVVAQALGDNAPKTETEVAQSEESQSGVQKSNGTEKEGEAKEVTAKEESGETDAKQTEQEKQQSEAELPPFHTHPRWIEQVEKVKTLQAEVEQSKPIVEQAKVINSYRQENNITDEQFEEALTIVALLNKDPKQAAEKLKATLDQLEVFNGTKLPPDLQAEVDEGNMPLTRAQEIVELRKRNAMTELQQKSSRVTQQKQSIDAMATALNSWEGHKIKTDPDYQRKAQFITDRFTALCQRTPPQSVNDVIKLAEEADAYVSKQLSTMVPKPPVSRHLSTTGSSTKTKAEPKTVDEAVEQALAGR